jgi:very-short-patch-repair endonuclease
MAARNIPDVVGESTVGTVADWRSAGVTQAQLRSLVRAGDLIQYRRGVYVTRKALDAAQPNPRRLHALRVAAVRASVGDAIASHHSAGRILGLDMLDPPAEDIVTLTRQPPQRSMTRPAAGVIFHNTAVPDWQLLEAFGVPLTSVSRTVVDIARQSSFMQGVVVADCALRLDKTSHPELMNVARSCKQWPGIEQAKKVIMFGDGKADSVLESCARVAFAEAGLEPPELQAEATVPHGVYWVDFLWRKYRTIAEADGLGKYGEASVLKKQFERDRQLRAAGYRVIHFTWEEIFHTPDYVVAQIREAFGAAH